MEASRNQHVAPMGGSKRMEAVQHTLDAFHETPIFEQIKEDDFPQRLKVLHELEDTAWEMVEKGEMSAVDAEEAISDCQQWVYEP